MRIFAIPAALLIACCLYLPLPKTAGCFEGMLRFFYAQALRLFKGKRSAADQKSALAVYLLLLCGVCILLGAIHPLAAMILMTPLFTGLASLPACAHTERELDSGKYANDIPSYERIVRESCLSVAPAFVRGVCAPMLLCAVGMPLRMAAPLGYAYAALCALSDQNDQAKRIRVGDVAEPQYYWGSDDIEARVESITTEPGNTQNKKITLNVTGSDISVGRNMSFILGERSANYDIVVPKSALHEDSNGNFVLIVSAKSTPLGTRYTATRADVEVIASDETNAAVTGALDSYEYIITASASPITSGMQVRLMEN